MYNLKDVNTSFLHPQTSKGKEEREGGREGKGDDRERGEEVGRGREVRREGEKRKEKKADRGKERWGRGKRTKHVNNGRKDGC